MNRLKLPARAKAIAIVAHPDDETIWLSGLLAKKKNWEWTIFSLCRASDPDRAPKFFKVCRHYGAQGLMADMEDEGRLSLAESEPVVEKLIKKYISGRGFDYIFTHGKNGEYGHVRHKAVYLAVKNLLTSGYFNNAKVFCFNCIKTGSKPLVRMIGAADSDLIIKLTKREYMRKRKVMTDIYGFTPDGIDTNYCTNPEAFKKLKSKN